MVSRFNRHSDGRSREKDLVDPDPVARSPGLSPDRAGGDRRGFARGGSAAPDFVVTDAQGLGSFTLSAHQGKVVLIEFFSTGCEHCHTYLPALQQIRTRYSTDDLTMISISVNWAHESGDVLRAYASETGINWFIAPDSGTITDDFNVGNTPTTVIVDKDGKIAFKRSGVISTADLIEEIDDLL